MKAVIIRELGGPEVMRLEEAPTPVPRPDEVLVRVHAVTVNRALDIFVRQDGGGYGPVLPLVLGVDPVGVVEALGDKVEGFKPGDRVAFRGRAGCGRCAFCEAGESAKCASPAMLGIQRWGGYAEYVVFPARNAIPIPDGLPFAEAAAVARHFPTAFSQARQADLKAGEWVLITGAAGGLGVCAIQVARHLGARVIAGASADERVEVARSFGADFGVNYRRGSLEQAVMEVTGGRGVDVVFENVGDPSVFPAAFRSLARGGRLLTVGAHGGGIVPLDMKRLYQYRLQIASGLGGEQDADITEALRLAAEGKFRVLIDRILPLSQVAEAHRLVAENEALGKVILDPTLP